MMELLVSFLFFVLMVIPFVTLVSLVYLVRLVQNTITPPVLLLMLTIEATVVLLCSGFLAALTVNTRFLGHTNPPELLPITLVALIAPLLMINVIAFVLRRVNGGGTGPK